MNATKSRSPRKYMNGFPFLIMLSILSRQPAMGTPDIEFDGATIFEIENDLEDATGMRPQQGAVSSALGTLRENGWVSRDEFTFSSYPTHVHTLTRSGEARVDACVIAIAKLNRRLPRNDADNDARGPRISGPARRRPRKRPDGRS